MIWVFAAAAPGGSEETFSTVMLMEYTGSLGHNIAPFFSSFFFLRNFYVFMPDLLRCRPRPASGPQANHCHFLTSHPEGVRGQPPSISAMVIIYPVLDTVTSFTLLYLTLPCPNPSPSLSPRPNPCPPVSGFSTWDRLSSPCLKRLRHNKFGSKVTRQQVLYTF